MNIIHYDQYGSFLLNKDEFSKFINTVSSLEYTKNVINNCEYEKLIHFCFCDIDSLYLEENSLYQQCIISWIILLGDKGYKFINWNYNNIDILNSKFCEQVKRYRYNVALADYIRWRVLYEFGGWYLDTDVIMVKPIDELSKDIKYIIPYEKFNDKYEDNRPETALMYSQPKLNLYELIYNYYDVLKFNDINQLKMFIKYKPSPHRVKDIMKIKQYKLSPVLDIDKYKDLVNNGDEKTIYVLSPLYLGNIIRTTLVDRFNKIYLPTPYTYAYHMFRTHWAYENFE